MSATDYRDPMKPSGGSGRTYGWRPDHPRHSGLSGFSRRLRGVLVLLFLCVLAGIIGWLLWFGTRRVPVLYFAHRVTSSYDRYPPNTGAAADEAALRDLFSDSTGNAQRSAGNRVLDDRLSERLPPNPTRSADAPASDRSGSNTIVFWSGHARINPEAGGHTELIAIREGVTNETAAGSDEVPISIGELLAVLARESTSNVLLFLDVGRLEPDWSLGLLAHDAAGAVERDVKESLNSLARDRKGPRIVVVCSCSPGQVSWVDTQTRPRPQSVFGRCLKEALEGRCDGCDESRPDQQISIRELLRYVDTNVNKWSLEHRGVRQNILIVPKFKEDDPFLTTALAVLRTDGKPKAEGKNQESASSQTGLDDKQSKDQRPTPPNEKANGEQLASDASEKDRLLLKQLWQRFAVDWKEAELLASAPVSLRALHANLLRAEQYDAAGLPRGFHDLVQRANEFSKEIQKKRLRQGNPWQPIPRSATKSRVFSDPVLSDDERKLFSAYFSAVAEEGGPPAKLQSARSDAKVVDGTEKRISKLDFRNFGQAFHFAVWLFEGPDKDVKSLARLFEKTPELLAISPTLPILSASVPRPWNPASRPLFLETLSLRFRLAALMSDLEVVPQIWPAIRNDAVDAFEATEAADRWWILGKGMMALPRFVRPNVKDSQERLEQIGRTVGTYRAAIRLRNRLLIELPFYAQWIARCSEDLVIGTEGDILAFQRWLNSQCHAQWQFDAPPSIATGEESRLLLDLMHSAAELCNAIEKSPAATLSISQIDDIESRTRETESAFRSFEERVEQRIRAAGDSLRRLQMTAEQWHTLDASALLPGMASRWAASSSALKTAKLQPSEGNRRERHADREGLFQAFWCFQTLALAGADCKDLDSAIAVFGKLLKALAGAEGSTATDLEAVRLRAALGRELQAEWGRLVQSPAHRDRAVRVLGPLRLWELDPKKTAEDLEPDASPSASPDLVAFRGRTREPSPRQTQRLEIPAGQLFDASGQQATIPLQVTGGEPTNHGPYFVLVQNDSGEFEASAAESDPVPVSGIAPKLQLRLKRGGVAPTHARLALLESIGKGDRTKRYYLHDVTPIDAKPPVNFAGWTVEFVTEENQRVHWDVEGGRLWLPADLAGSKLVARLKRPAERAANTLKVEVQCYALDSNGKPGKGLFDRKVPISFATGQEIAEVAVPAAAPPAGVPTSPPASSPPLLVDVTNGLRFTVAPIEQDGRSPTAAGFQRDVRFWFWSARTYISEPIEGAEPITFTLKPRSTGPAQLQQDEVSLLPQEFHVALHVPSRFPIRGNKTLNEVLKLGEEPKTLQALLADDFLQRPSNEINDFWLDIGPWTHAYWYQLRNGRAVNVAQDFGHRSLEITEPADHAILPTRKKLPPGGDDRSKVLDVPSYQIQINVADLDDRDVPAEKALELKAEIIDSQGNAANPDLIDGRVVSSWKKRIQLALPLRRDWSFVTSVGDYGGPLKVAGRSGRFKLRAFLTAKGDPTPLAEHSIRFAVDNDAPRVSIQSQSPVHDYKYDDALKLRVEAADDESGIASVLVVYSSRATLSEHDIPPTAKEILWHYEPPKEQDGFRPVRAPLPASITVERKPPEGEWYLYALAEDDWGHRTLSDPIVAMFRPKPAPPKEDKPSMPASPIAKKPGSIVIQFDTSLSRRYKIKLSGGGLKEPMNRERSDQAEQVVFSDLPPGKYELTFTVLSGLGLPGAPMEVVVEEDKATTLRAPQ